MPRNWFQWTNHLDRQEHINVEDKRPGSLQIKRQNTVDDRQQDSSLYINKTDNNCQTNKVTTQNNKLDNCLTAGKNNNNPKDKDWAAGQNNNPQDNLYPNNENVLVADKLYGAGSRQPDIFLLEDNQRDNQDNFFSLDNRIKDSR